VFLLKQSLTTIIAIDLFVNKTFPSSDEVSTSVRVAQFLLLAVNCAVQEELVITFFIYANLKWSRSIMDLNPGATFGKYHASNMARLSDGLSFLLVNATVMFQQVDVLNMFLCFAALQFLQSIDNVALELARKGYLSEMLQSAAKDVEFMKLPRNHNPTLQLLDTVGMIVTFLVLVSSWLAVTLRSFQL
jgi:hypothetical protein